MKKKREATIARSMPWRHYKARPMRKGHPATGQLWPRYMTTRRAVPKWPGIIGRAIGNWKQFFLAEAYNDSMAIVLILAHQEMLNLLQGGSRRAAGKSIPRSVSGPIERLSRMSAGSNLNGEGDELSVRTSMNWKVDLMEGKGTAVEVRCNEQDVIVGLLVKSPEGMFLAINSVPTQKIRSAHDLNQQI